MLKFSVGRAAISFESGAFRRSGAFGPKHPSRRVAASPLARRWIFKKRSAAR
jgi:hypothetical protein